MEEKKEKKEVKMSAGKEVKLAPVKGGEQPQKLTYEQLNDTCMQLYQQNQNLVKQLQQANLANQFRRIDYLFEVLKCADVVDDPDFIRDCVGKIKLALGYGQQEEPVKEEA